MSTPLALRLLLPEERDAFFAYLADHLGDNGMNGTPLFQPAIPGSNVLVPEKVAALTAGLERELDEPGWRRIWIAIDNTDQGGVIAGHVDLRSRADILASHRTLLGMGVHRAYRRRGLGFALITHALNWATSQPQLHWVDLEVMAINDSAQRLYERHGFVKLSETPDMFRIGGQPYSYISMTRPLHRDD
ncbi:MAG TPA: GNAT family N-acetyltransferase [Burkholderiaceae bacterium]